MPLSFPRKLLATVLLVNLFMLAIAVVSAYQGHHQYLERAKLTTQNLVTVLEGNLVSTIRRIEVSLLALADVRTDNLPAARLDWHIEQLRTRLPAAEAIRMTDAEGSLIHGSDIDPAAQLSVADRPHFIALRDTPAAGLQISKPIISRVNGKWVIVLARRMNQPDGSFAGIVFATVAIDHLYEMLATINLGPGGSVLLRDAELGMVARHPLLPDQNAMIGQAYGSPQLRALLQAGKNSGTYTTAASPDGVTRTLSFRRIEPYGLYAFVGMAESDYLADWRNDVRGLALLVVLFMLASLYAAKVHYRAWQREEADKFIIREQEALYHELVEDTPVMVLRYLPDTEITFANNAYANFFGTTADALTGKQWYDFLSETEDRNSAREHIDRLTPARPISTDKLYRMLGKDGQTHWTQWTVRAYFDEIGRLTHLQSVGQDITERKRNRDIQAARLRLMEYAIDHTMHELLVATLDEAGVLTESPIGFYHFLAPDQKTLSLQAWSTRTLQEYCHAKGDGLHYNIDEAGVWVDAIRLKKPVIHNDYATLPNKHGLPPGHATVLREMVVPVFRKGLIVAIIGVGNKPTPYTSYDMETVSLLADLAWDFAESKRLEAELIEMATTDFLTGLFNRRTFMQRMEEELERLKRFDIQRAAVLMLDLDHFKVINDTYGHAAGDAVLKQFAAQIGAELRKIDSGGRIGGEEFAILLLGADRAAANHFAERLRHTAAETTLSFEGKRISVTVSIGITLLEAEDQNAGAALARADAALYIAKRDGRNRVCDYADHKNC